MLPALERENPLALGRGDDQGVHLAFADGAQRLTCESAPWLAVLVHRTPAGDARAP